MTRKRTRRIWYLILVGFAAVTLISGLIALQPYGTPLNRLVRGAAALGYLAIFLAIISSNYMRQLVRFFGRPFVQIHHILSVTGLVMVTLHPLGTAWSNASLRVWLPRLDSWLAFLEWGGLPPGTSSPPLRQPRYCARPSAGTGERSISSTTGPSCWEPSTRS